MAVHSAKEGEITVTSQVFLCAQQQQKINETDLSHYDAAVCCSGLDDEHIQEPNLTFTPSVTHHPALYTDLNRRHEGLREFKIKSSAHILLNMPDKSKIPYNEA